MAVNETPKLTAKQERFVQEYLIDLNATQAAIRAGYSEKTASVVGCENLTKPNVAEAIAEAKLERSERTEVTQDQVVRELSRLGFSDLRHVMTDDGALKFPSEWDDNTAASIASIEVVTRPTGEKDDQDRPVVEHIHKIKTWDKNTALTNLGKHLAMFVDRTQVEPSDALSELLSAVAKGSKRIGT